ncbi:hypothetical protein E4T47_01482 [Aureobasidium subglaciale]|nr:hypothetical protein E4T47_01482 [Aureobasidium subglaciale]
MNSPSSSQATPDVSIWLPCEAHQPHCITDYLLLRPQMCPSGSRSRARQLVTCRSIPLVNSDASVRFLSRLSSLPASHCILPPLS